jgi:hypothetical protein
VEGALHNYHYMLISYVWVGMGLDLWGYGLQEWADSALFTISICILYGMHYVVPARRLASSSCFSWMKRLHSHTQLVRLQQVN